MQVIGTIFIKVEQRLLWQPPLTNGREHPEDDTLQSVLNIELLGDAVPDQRTEEIIGEPAGVAPLQPQDLIALQQQGISPRVIATMQACPPQVPQPQAVVVEQPAPPPVVVGVDPYWGPRYYPRRYGW